jgi:hypothetical protein
LVRQKIPELKNAKKFFLRQQTDSPPRIAPEHNYDSVIALQPTGKVSRSPVLHQRVHNEHLLVAPARDT